MGDRRNRAGGWFGGGVVPEGRVGCEGCRKSDGILGVVGRSGREGNRLFLPLCLALF